MAALTRISIGTRESKLALAQALLIKKLILENNISLRDYPDFISIIPIKTTGDKIADKSLSEIGGKGLFTKEIEEALLEKKIDIAIHSMKDMPATMPHGLDIFAVPLREDARDAFISKKYQSIADLPNRAVVGTSSSRRKSMLLNIRPNLEIVNLRGNIDTRLKKIDDGEVEATILAVAGLKRINKENYIRTIISPEQILPAVAQGAIAVQARKNDQNIIDLISKINDQNSNICVSAERAFLKIIDGSCKTPMAAYCQITDDNYLYLRAMICSLDGKEIYQSERFGKVNLDDAARIGAEAGLEVKKNAKNILYQI